MGRLVRRYIRVYNLTVANRTVIKGRISSMTEAGGEIELGAAYTRGELIEIRTSVTSWTGIGNQFQLMFLRSEAAVDATGKTLRAMEVLAANADGIDIGTMQVFMFNTMGKGGSTITLMRGGEIKLEWASDDTVTNARALQIEFAGLKAPTNPVYGIYFEKESAAAAMAAKFYEIRMKEGLCIISGSGAPTISAPKGSLYLRTDGTTTNDRAYINTDGATTWTAITTVA